MGDLEEPLPFATWAIRLPLIEGVVYLEIVGDPDQPGRTRWVLFTSRLGLLREGRSGEA